MHPASDITTTKDRSSSHCCRINRSECVESKTHSVCRRRRPYGTCVRANSIARALCGRCRLPPSYVMLGYAIINVHTHIVLFGSIPLPIRTGPTERADYREPLAPHRTDRRCRVQRFILSQTFDAYGSALRSLQLFACSPHTHTRVNSAYLSYANPSTFSQ